MQISTCLELGCCSKKGSHPDIWQHSTLQLMPALLELNKGAIKWLNGCYASANEIHAKYIEELKLVNRQERTGRAASKSTWGEIKVSKLVNQIGSKYCSW